MCFFSFLSGTCVTNGSICILSFFPFYPHWDSAQLHRRWFLPANKSYNKMIPCFHCRHLLHPKLDYGLFTGLQHYSVKQNYFTHQFCCPMINDEHGYRFLKNAVLIFNSCSRTSAIMVPSIPSCCCQDFSPGDLLFFQFPEGSLPPVSRNSFGYFPVHAPEFPGFLPFQLWDKA